MKTTTISKVAYDELCDKVRNLTTAAEQYNRNTTRKTEVIKDLIEQCCEDRIKMVDRIKSFEELLSKLKINRKTK